RQVIRILRTLKCTEVVVICISGRLAVGIRYRLGNLASCREVELRGARCHRGSVRVHTGNIDGVDVPAGIEAVDSGNCLKRNSGLIDLLEVTAQRRISILSVGCGARGTCRICGIGGYIFGEETDTPV